MGNLVFERIHVDGGLYFSLELCIRCCQVVFVDAVHHRRQLLVDMLRLA